MLKRKLSFLSVSQLSGADDGSDTVPAMSTLSSMSVCLFFCFSKDARESLLKILITAHRHDNCLSETLNR